MEQQDFDKVFTRISTGKAVKIALAVKKSPEKQRLDCVYREEEPPVFSLLFPPDTLPIEELDTSRQAAITIDLGGQNVSLSADIEEVVDNQTLRLVAREVITHQQLRDYFRVDVSAPLVAKPVFPSSSSEDEQPLAGETVDVSGGGLLALFPRPIDPTKPISLELILPSSTESRVVKAIAHVVRTQKITDHQYKIALHFDQISPEDRDAIMACCFEIQRRHLRLKVKVKV